MSQTDCPVCKHPNVELINRDLSMGVDFPIIAVNYKIDASAIIDHWTHGVEEEGRAENLEMAISTDLYTLLNNKLRLLNLKFKRLESATPATGESKEMISLSKAIDDTIKTLMVVRKEYGISDETRIQELERTFNELISLLDQFCPTDRKKLEAALGLESLTEAE